MWLFTRWTSGPDFSGEAGFSHSFHHLFYYPALAGLAVLFNSFRLNMVWVTMTSVVYVAISLTVGDGIDTEARDEKALLARIAVMYAVVGAVNLATRFERMRWRQAVERERALERERVELSQSIHDTAAQSAYMVGLGIDTAKAIAGDANQELTSTLEATSRLSRSVILELRHPINVGGIYEGRELSRALRSHATSFTNVTSVPVEMTHTGAEPPLSVEARSLLFSIGAQRAHQRMSAMRKRTGWPSTWSLLRIIADSRCRTTGSGFPMITRSAVTASRT